MRCSRVGVNHSRVVRNLNLKIQTTLTRSGLTGKKHANSITKLPRSMVTTGLRHVPSLLTSHTTCVTRLHLRQKMVPLTLIPVTKSSYLLRHHSIGTFVTGGINC